MVETARHEIRRAQIGDAAEMTRLAERLGYPMTVAEMTERLAALLLNGCHCIAVAASGEHLLGRVHVEHRSSLELGELSHPFYEALGYTRDKTQHVYSKALKSTREAACRTDRR